MKVGASASAPVADPQAAERLRQVLVLKKALKAQQQAADQVLKMSETKGQIVDLRA